MHCLCSCTKSIQRHYKSPMHSYLNRNGPSRAVSGTLGSGQIHISAHCELNRLFVQCCLFVYHILIIQVAFTRFCYFPFPNLCIWCLFNVWLRFPSVAVMIKIVRSGVRLMEIFPGDKKKYYMTYGKCLETVAELRTRNYVYSGLWCLFS